MANQDEPFPEDFFEGRLTFDIEDLLQKALAAVSLELPIYTQENVQWKWDQMTVELEAQVAETKNKEMETMREAWEGGWRPDYWESAKQMSTSEQAAERDAEVDAKLQEIAKKLIEDNK